MVKMVSRFTLFPKDVLFYQTSFLTAEETQKLCTERAITRLLTSPDYIRFRFECDFTTDKQWLKDYFLTDERYRDIPAADIPPSVFNYYEALREARFITNQTNNTAIHIVDSSIIYDYNAACCNKFDNYFYRCINDFGRQLDAELEETSLRTINKLLSAIVHTALRYNRLAVFKAICQRLNVDNCAMRASHIVIAKEQVDNKWKHLLARDHILQTLLMNETMRRPYGCFDNDFYAYLTSSDFDQWSDKMLSSFHITIAIFYGDLEKFVMHNGPITDSTVQHLYSNDAVELIKQLPISSVSLQLARNSRAPKTLAYFATLPQFMSAYQYDNVCHKMMSNLRATFTPHQLRYFFAHTLAAHIIAIDWSSVPDGDQQWSIIASPGFMSNYRALTRNMKNVSVLECAIAICRMMARRHYPIAPINSDRSELNTILLLQEMLRLDLVKDPDYRWYLAFIFDKLTKFLSLDKYRPKALSYLYFLYVKYCYLHEIAPCSFEIHTWEDIVPHLRRITTPCTVLFVPSPYSPKTDVKILTTNPGMIDENLNNNHAMVIIDRTAAEWIMEQL